MATKSGDLTKAQILADDNIDIIQYNRNLTWKDKKAIKTAEEFTPTTSGDWVSAPSSQDDALDGLADTLNDVNDAVGISLGDADMGSYTGSTITDDQSVKENIQELETALEEIDANADDLVTLSGVAENATDLGTFTGDLISDSSTVKAALQEVETGIESIQQSVSGTISSAEILALNATPKELIPAPGAGYAIVVDEIQMMLDYGSATYVRDGANEEFLVEYAGGTDIWAPVEATDDFLVSIATARRLVKPEIYTIDTGVVADPADFDNEAVQATITNSEVITGDSDIKYSIKYHVIALLS